MNMGPEISVVMSVYNESVVYISQAIESILEQTYKNFEFIIILDNPSRKDLIDYICSLDDERIVFIVNDKNIGLPLSLNKGIIASRGKYIARMDADDIAVPVRLEKQLMYIRENQIDLCSAFLFNINDKGAVVGKSKIYNYTSKEINKLLNWRNPLAHPTWFFKKNLFIEVGGYRDFHSCEDYDFLLRCKNIGAEFAVVPECLLYYRYNIDSISNTNALKQLVSSEILRKNKKNLEQLNESRFEDLVKRKLSVAKSSKFTMAKRYFTKASRCSGIKKVFYIIRSIWESRYILYLYRNSIITAFLRVSRL